VTPPAAAVASPVAELREVAFAYGTRSVLRGVDLRIDPGELLAIVGVNGSGKTTLLRLLAGTITPSSGAVAVFGRRVSTFDRRDLARRVAVLPQSLELPSGFRVAEIVEMGRTPHARSRFGATADDEAAVERALLDAGALDLADRPVEELSGGERQRVLVAMALAQEPELLLLDEPTVHLDLGHQVALLDTVERQRRSRGMTVVAVLHDLALAASYATRVALLDGGRIVAEGLPGDVLRPPLLAATFGVSLDEAITPDGARHLVLGDRRF
jgi:iron complex transport system ATP-binding protein